MGRWLFVVFVSFVLLFCACGDNGDAGGGEIANGTSGDAGLEATTDAVSSTFDVKDAAARTNTSITVTFDAAPNAAQATTLANYSVPGLTLSGPPELSPAGDAVTIATSEQLAQLYTVTVKDVTRASDGAPLSGTTAMFLGRAVFDVVGAKSVSATKVSVTFDAPPDDAQATTLANYDVPGLTLSAPSLLGNTVTFTTNVQEAKPYTITVANVTRKSDGEKLGVTTADFTGRLPFSFASATATNGITLKVTFDAPPNAAQAVVLASYAVSGLTLTGTPVLDGNTVTLTTSPQAAQTYTLKVSNVTRASDAEPLLTGSVDFAGKKSAKLLVTELAPANASGTRFVELVATEAGALGQLTVRSARVGNPLYVFADLDVAAGDRFVVHLTALPGPAGYAQEDVQASLTASTAARASATAYDVYSAETALTSTDNVVSVTLGTTTEDAVAFSQRGAASAAGMTAYADARAAGAWAFTAVPVLGTNDCATQLEAVNASGTSAPACGGWPAELTAGYSLQRNGTTDTNTKADWDVAAETPGAANAAFCPDAEGAKLAITEVNPNVTGGLDLTELSVTKGGWLRGFSLRRDPRAGTLGGQNLATFPDTCVATGDIIVIHHAIASGSPSETTAKDQYAAADNAGYYDGAWDFAGLSSQALPFGASLVLAVRDPTDAYVDAAAFTDGSASTNYDAALQYVQGLGLWLPADCGGALCSDASTPTSRQIAADWNGVDTSASGNSIKKSSAGAAASAASWSVGASSFGAVN